MYYHAETDQYIYPGTFFQINGIQYEPNWLNYATPEQITALGLEPVTFVDEWKSDKYYWLTQEFNGPIVTNVSTPKDLDQVKALAISQINQTAYTLLLQSDWMLIRKYETNIDVPTEWSQYRDNVRMEALLARGQVDNATTVDEVAAVVPNWPANPDAPVITPPADPEAPTE